MHFCIQITECIRKRHAFVLWRWYAYWLANRYWVKNWWTTFIIHQIFSLARDWSKHVTWPNITQLKLGDIREYPPIFKTARVAKKIWRIINTIASIWGENMLGYLSLDIICSSKLTVFLELRSRKTVRFSEQIMSADKYPSIFSRQMEAIVYI